MPGCLISSNWQARLTSRKSDQALTDSLPRAMSTGAVGDSLQRGERVKVERRGIARNDSALVRHRHRFGTAVNLKLREDPLNMCSDRLRADDQPLCNLLL